MNPTVSREIVGVAKRLTYIVNFGDPMGTGGDSPLGDIRETVADDWHTGGEIVRPACVAVSVEGGWDMEYDKLKRKGREKYLDKAVLAPRGYIRRRLLGQGAFSDVYCVEDIWEGRQYACKVSAHVEMLEREAHVMEGLCHPLFPRLMGFWREGGIGILLREYVEGHSLEEMLQRRHFSARQTMRVGLLLAEGLRYLHELPEGLLFRDVKPANVIICQDGGVKLIDFGCACSVAEKAASRAGSPGFAAPEQLRKGGMLTESCDVYGLGRTLEAMLGVRAREGRCHSYRGNIGKTARARKAAAWRCLKARRLERELRRFLTACTEEDPRNRVADMREVVEKFMWICIDIRNVTCYNKDDREGGSSRCQ